MIEDILNILKEIKNNVKIGLKWIKGHSNIKGNDMADKLARKAIKLTIPKIILPITLEEIKIKARDISLKNWQSRWNFLDHEIARKFYPTVPIGKLTTEKRLNN